jgi:5-methyltetrahydrofolate--homocysteine methyltransferase
LSETGYDETPADTSGAIATFASEGLVNVVGGCCGTTPDHIKAIKERMEEFGPRPVPDAKTGLRLSGLEPMNFRA